MCADSRQSPGIIEFGPRRVIGMSHCGKSDSGQLPRFWREVFLPRMGEVRQPSNRQETFGICRCIEGATDGSFEYIAGLAAAPEADVPQGMMSLVLPQFQYAVFEATSLEALPGAYERMHEWVGGNTEWDAMCGPKGCACTTYPMFEFYPPEFGRGGSLFLYVPVKRKN